MSLKKKATNKLVNQSAKPVVKTNQTTKVTKKNIVESSKTKAIDSKKIAVCLKKKTKSNSTELKWPSLINNNNKLTQAMSYLFHNNEQTLKKYEITNNKFSLDRDHLANLLVSLLTDDKLMQGKYSLTKIIEAANSISKKVTKEADTKNVLAKRLIGK